MVVARASGTDLASSLKQNTFDFRGAPGRRSARDGAPRAEFRHRNNNSSQNLFCFKLDAMSVPEALVTTIRILRLFSIVLAHQWGPRPWVRPAPSGTPHGPP